jgi:hypothetical protein
VRALPSVCLEAQTPALPQPREALEQRIGRDSRSRRRRLTSCRRALCCDGGFWPLVDTIGVRQMPARHCLRTVTVTLFAVPRRGGGCTVLPCKRGCTAGCVTSPSGAFTRVMLAVTRRGHLRDVSNRALLFMVRAVPVALKHPPSLLPVIACQSTHRCIASAPQATAPDEARAAARARDAGRGLRRAAAQAAADVSRLHGPSASRPAGRRVRSVRAGHVAAAGLRGGGRRARRGVRVHGDQRAGRRAPGGYSGGCY